MRSAEAMTPSREAELLVKAMDEEAGLLERIIGLELQVKSFVAERSWERLERTIREIEPIAQRIGEVEAARDAAFKALAEMMGVGPEAGFYQILVLLPHAAQERVGEAYRRLRLTVLGLQSQNMTVGAYLETIIQTIHAALAEIYPFRKGKIYSRRGRAKPAEPHPMVVSRRL